MAGRSKLFELAELEIGLKKAAGSLSELRVLTAAESGAGPADVALASSAELGDGIETLLHLIQDATTSVDAEIGRLLQGGS